jgi:hypothetical protein
MQCPSRAIVNPSDEFGRIVNLVDERAELVSEVDDVRKGHTTLGRQFPCTRVARSNLPATNTRVHRRRKDRGQRAPYRRFFGRPRTPTVPPAAIRYNAADQRRAAAANLEQLYPCRGRCICMLLLALSMPPGTRDTGTILALAGGNLAFKEIRQGGPLVQLFPVLQIGRHAAIPTKEIACVMGVRVTARAKVEPRGTDLSDTHQSPAKERVLSVHVRPASHPVRCSISSSGGRLLSAAQQKMET